MPGRLYRTITHRLFKEYGDDPRYAHFLTEPLTSLLRHMHHFSFEVRKFIVNAMRVQQPIYDNNYLSTELYKLGNMGYAVVGDDDEILPYSQLVDWVDRVMVFSPSCAVLSFFARAESTAHEISALAIRMETYNKELQAALEYHPFAQRLDYSTLFHDQEIRPIHPEFGVLSPNTRFVWKRGIRQLRDYLSSNRSTPLLPFLNRRKNLGYKTQEAFKSLVGSTSSKMDITSAELLRHYMYTGEMVYGPLELRIAWRYNDLKPRVYYALGGDAYWAGLHIKQVANAICNIFPSTNPFSRFNIQRLDMVGPDQILVTYDYTSFTTSLEELKAFLFWLGQELSGVSVDILDVHHGIRRVELSGLIHSYNELVNLHQSVDCSRFTLESFDTIFQQGRNGSLGVQGNIVFSTILHGVSLGGVTDSPMSDSVVGDDALFLIMGHLVTMMMVCVNSLGIVHPDKFSMLSRPPVENPNVRIYEAFKYLKRPISVDLEGHILTGTLDFFPSLADALFPEKGDGVHAPQEGRSYPEVVKTFCTQWGRFLHQNPLYPQDLDLYESEIFIILALVQSVYDKYGLAYRGQIPGSSMLCWSPEGEMFNEDVQFWVPPCDSSRVFTHSWMDLLYWEFHDQNVIVPLRTGTTAPPVAVMENETFQATSHETLTLLEHLGCLKKRAVMQEMPFDEVMLEDQKKIMRGEEADGILYDFLMIYVPHWYTDLMTYYLPALVNPDGEESVRVIESLFDQSTIYNSE